MTIIRTAEDERVVGLQRVADVEEDDESACDEALIEGSDAVESSDEE